MPAARARLLTPDGLAGELQFDIPGGWEKVNDGGTMELKPMMQQGHPLTRIGFLAPVTLHGNARQDFEAVWAQWRTRMNMIDNGEPAVSHPVPGIDLITRYSRAYAPSLGNGKFWLRWW